MGITEAVTYAGQRVQVGTRAATTGIWRRDCAAYLVLRRDGRFRALGEQLMSLTLGTEQEIQASDEWHQRARAAGV
jgi:hypothetical protein